MRKKFAELKRDLQLGIKIKMIKDKKALSHYLGLESVKDLKKIKYKKALKYAIKNNLEFCLSGDWLVYFEGEDKYNKNEYIKTINDITLFRTNKKGENKK